MKNFNCMGLRNPTASDVPKERRFVLWAQGTSFLSVDERATLRWFGQSRTNGAGPPWAEIKLLSLMHVLLLQLA